MGLILKNNKLLVVSNKLTTDPKCCCNGTSFGICPCFDVFEWDVEIAGIVGGICDGCLFLNGLYILPPVSTFGGGCVSRLTIFSLNFNGFDPICNILGVVNASISLGVGRKFDFLTGEFSKDFAIGVDIAFGYSNETDIGSPIITIDAYFELNLGKDVPTCDWGSKVIPLLTYGNGPVPYFSGFNTQPGPPVYCDMSGAVCTVKPRKP